MIIERSDAQGFFDSTSELGQLARNFIFCCHNDNKKFSSKLKK